MASIESPSFEPDDNRGSILSHKHVWGGFVIIIVIVFIAALLYFCYKKKLYSNCRLPWKQKGGNLDEEKMTVRRFQLEELEKATNNFSKDCLIGSGAFGNVYIGSFGGKAKLAIKKAHSDSYTSSEEFRNEVRLLSKVKHENLVGLVGFCEQGGMRGAKILVYEYVSNGSLLEYIMGRGGKSLTWRQRVTIAIGAAKGIAHLHEEIKPSIIHRDIKPSNILVGEGFEAKVSDFGLVKSGPTDDQSHVSSQIKGTPGYLDPAYCSSFHLTPFSDVYSFGVILLQLVAARPAVNTTRNHTNYHIIDWARTSLEKGNIEEIVDANLLFEPCNMEMMLKMGRLGLKCVEKMPKQRPTITQVWQELESALHKSENLIYKHPTTGPCRSSACRAHSRDHSETSVSIDGVGLERFGVYVDSLSFQSASLRCLENNDISVEFDMGGVGEERSMSMDYDISIPRD